MLVLLAAAACAPPAPTPAPTLAPESMRGLLVLDRGSRDSRLWAWLGADSSPGRSMIEVDPNTEQFAASTAGRIVTKDMDDDLRVSAPMSSDQATLEPAWRDLELVSDGSPLFEEGQIDFASWDATGSRLALTIGTGMYGYGLLIVDPDTGVTQTTSVPAASSVLGPVWLDHNTIAVTIPDVDVTEPTDSRSPTIDFSFSTAVVDITSGKVSSGPARSALAGSPDGTLVVTTGHWGELAPLTIQDTETWLRGSDEALATLEALAGALSGMILAFDRSGSRVAVAWWTGEESMEDAMMTLRVYEAASGWRPVADLPVTDCWPILVAWLP